MSKKIVILGAGESGVGAALLAKKNKYEVFVSDSGSIKERYKTVLLNNRIDYEEGSHTESIIMQADEVVKSPGIPEDAYIVREISKKNISIVSEIEFAFRYTQARIIGVTGTNGKTTTTLLVSHILRNAGFEVLTAGNIGQSFAGSIIDKDYEIIVLEISSFQLDNLVDFRPDIAIILNITSDHLDRYENNLQKYVESKLKITKNQKKSDILIYNSDDNFLRRITTSARKLAISLQREIEEGAFYKNNQINIKLNNIIMTIQELALQGKHNIFNSMAAAMAARVFEVQDSTIRQSLIDFESVEHRLEYVLTVHGIDFINDSKATNINSCWYALESMNKDVVWIVGGVDKGNDYDQLLDLVEQKVKAIVCLGEDNSRILKTFKGKTKITEAKNMQEAVNFSYSLANSGDTVLLSPACASFDLFANFEERGLAFKSLVRKL